MDPHEERYRERDRERKTNQKKKIFVLYELYYRQQK